jgi:hypothetical protein
MPDAQEPDAQVVPQAPQLRGSLARSAHTPAQSVNPDGQAHALLTQTSTPPQTVLQKPQCCLSLVRSTHEVPHSASPGSQPGWHMP